VPPEPFDVLGLTCSRFAEAASKRGIGAGTALTLYRAAFREGRFPAGIAAPAMPVAAVRDEGATRKFTQRLGGLETETVILPQRSRTGRPRTTLCVSSQVGCARGCTFCETAQMGLMRNLSASEIVAQWHAARFVLGAPIDNVVFMGMGEPMDNLGAVTAAIEVLADSNGAAVPPSRITVSTVGVAAGIERLGELARREGFRQLRLAVSLNAPNDEIRARIMPIARAVPIARLMAAMAAWPGGRVLIEYVLIPGVNDEIGHADALGALLGGIACTINVIPYNPRRDSPWPAPPDDVVDRFAAAVAARGARVIRRRTMGRSVMAACGQLGSAAIRGRRPAPVEST
jgi:23S rRNA (adenine2503-C2)-methyltransferase